MSEPVSDYTAVLGGEPVPHRQAIFVTPAEHAVLIALRTLNEARRQAVEASDLVARTRSVLDAACSDSRAAAVAVLHAEHTYSEQAKRAGYDADDACGE
jgi:hypothetical protein